MIYPKLGARQVSTHTKTAKKSLTCECRVRAVNAASSPLQLVSAEMIVSLALISFCTLRAWQCNSQPLSRGFSRGFSMLTSSIRRQEKMTNNRYCNRTGLMMSSVGPLKDACASTRVSGHGGCTHDEGTGKFYCCDSFGRRCASHIARCSHVHRLHAPSPPQKV